MKRSSLKRSLEIGLLAKDVAKLKMAREATRGKRQQRVVERLGLLHGLPQKIGQLMAFSELDGSDPAFTPLTEGVAEMPFCEVKQALLSELKASPIGRTQGIQEIDQVLSLREPQGVGASIGQVYPAQLKEGTKVAIKLQYPGIAEAIDHDLSRLGWLLEPVGGLKRGFDIDAYKQEIGQMLRSELDYRLEASSMAKFADLVRRDADLAATVRVPRVHSALSTDRLLISDWLEGVRTPDVVSWSETSRWGVGSTMVRLFMRSVFDWRFLHADPHPGNYRFFPGATSPALGLLDYGCVKVLPKSFVSGLQSIIESVADGTIDRDIALEGHHRMGFDLNLLKPIEEALAELSNVLFAPFKESKAFDFREWQVKVRVRDLLGEYRMNYRMAGPAEMVYLVRAFQGLTYYLKAFGAKVDWQTLFIETIGDKGGWKKTEQGKEKPLENVPTAENKSEMLADSLRIRVTEWGKDRVALAFSAAATDHLADLIPPDLGPKLKARGIAIPTIVDRAKASHYAPGELFCLEDGPKQVRVWLE